MYKRLFLFVGIALLPVLLWSLAGKETNTSFQEAHEILQFRRIGHELLLSGGDTKSRVLPISKVSKNEFSVEFENPLAFTPDTLVKVVSRVLKASEQQVHYIFNMREAKSKEVMYSFAWPDEIKNIPCGGRSLPEGKYTLNILVSPSPIATNNSRSITLPAVAAGLLAICLAIFAWKFTRRKTGEMPAMENTSFTAIGKFRFYPAQHLLAIDQIAVELTSKETKLLRIFSDSPNQVIDRNQLLKEGWEDEGVITGRSLDMYVSKLRKKLQADPSVSIINVHGKGYRLNC
jgi:DNA-binding winged helix-turn-helix (wHTH) protein